MEWFDSHTFPQTRRHRRSWVCRRSGSWSGWCFWSWAWQAWSRRRSSASAGSVQQPLGTPTTRTTPRHILRSASHVSFAKTAPNPLLVASARPFSLSSPTNERWNFPPRFTSSTPNLDPILQSLSPAILAFVSFSFRFFFRIWTRQFCTIVRNKESLFQLDHVYRTNNTVQESSLIN